MRGLGAGFWIVAAGLVVVQAAVRPLLGDSRFLPDFVLVALLLYAINVRQGAGAVAGLVVGIATDAVVPTAFGAAALAHTVVGYAAGWLRVFVVAENIAVTALFIALCAWLRDVIQALAANQLSGGGLMRQLFGYSPVAALATGVTALVLLVVLRGVLVPRGRS